MSRKWRYVALALPLTLAALHSSEGAGSLGTCKVACVGSGIFQNVTFQATQSDCCSGTVNNCPPGTSPRGTSWNSFRC